MVNFVRTFEDVKTPEKQKKLVVESYLQWHWAQFEAQAENGGTQSWICYMPPDQDLLRLMMGKYWALESTMSNRFFKRK